jgi:hypothetical protein
VVAFSKGGKSHPAFAYVALKNCEIRVFPFGYGVGVLDDILLKAKQFVGSISGIVKISERDISLDPCFVVPVVRLDLGSFVLCVDDAWLEKSVGPGFVFDLAEALEYSDRVKEKYFDPRTVFSELVSGLVSNG